VGATLFMSNVVRLLIFLCCIVYWLSVSMYVRNAVLVIMLILMCV